MVRFPFIDNANHHCFKWGKTNKVLALFEANGLPLLCILTDRVKEYCGNAKQHDYQLYLAINDIDYTKTKVKSPQTNGICERFHKTTMQEFYQVTVRKKAVWKHRRTPERSGYMDRLLQH